MMARREHFFLTFEPSRSISSPLPPKGQRNGDFSLSFAFRSQVIEVIVLRRRRGLGGFIPSFSYVIRAFPVTSGQIRAFPCMVETDLKNVRVSLKTPPKGRRSAQAPDIHWSEDEARDLTPPNGKVFQNRGMESDRTFRSGVAWS